MSASSLNIIAGSGNSIIGTLLPAGTINLFATLGYYANHLSLISDGVNTWYVVGGIQ